MYRVKGILHFSEEDTLDGCIPGTGKHYRIEKTFSEESVTKLLQNICDFLYLEKEAMDIEDDRVDIGKTETEWGSTPTAQQMAEFKKGKLKLRYAVYTFYVEEVLPVSVKETLLKESL